MTYVGAVLDRVDGDVVVVDARRCRIYAGEPLAAKVVDGIRVVVAEYFRLTRAFAAVSAVVVALSVVVVLVAVTIANTRHLQWTCR